MPIIFNTTRKKKKASIYDILVYKKNQFKLFCFKTKTRYGIDDGWMIEFKIHVYNT